jgi:putative hemolysin
MNTSRISILLILAFAAILTSCSPAPIQPETVAASTGTAQAGMANPASVYCEQQGNRLEIRTAADGGQSGVCVFPDGGECDEWAYFRGECGAHPTTIQTSVLPTQTGSAPSISMIPQSIPLPSGAIINPREDTISVTQSMIFYDTARLTLGELRTPNAIEVHAAGHYQGSLDLPLAFDAVDPDGQKYSIDLNSGSLRSNPGGQVSTLVSLPDQALVSGLVGVPGQPLVFYIEFQALGSTVRSQCMLGPIDSLPTVSPILTLESSESRYWKPVAIQMKDDTPRGLWFTRTPWGIGGDIVFPYYEGLSYYDLSSGTLSEVLSPEVQFDSLSIDQTHVVYSVRRETGFEFYIRDLKGGPPVLLPTRPENDRGAGNGLFSPTNKYIAWREAQGSLADGSFQQVIRIATLDGQILAEYTDMSFYKTAELTGSGMTIQPGGWLDDENILVQITSMEKPYGGSVVKLNVVTGEFSLFARGFFAGFFYP